MIDDLAGDGDGTAGRNVAGDGDGAAGRNVIGRDEERISPEPGTARLATASPTEARKGT
jgi:hypothetical protein